MLRVTLVILSLLLATLLIGGALLGTEYHIERSEFIHAEPRAIYEQIATPKTWPEWTTWNKDLDETAKWTFQGADTGAGAVMVWDGDPNKLSHGELHILRADVTTGVDYELSFQRAEYKVTGTLKLEPGSAGTRVIWTSDGSYGSKPFGGWIKLLVGSYLDQAMGGDFEKGLSRLKERIESPKPPGSTPAK